MSEPQHFSDYGFDPQIDYFQVRLFDSSFDSAFSAACLMTHLTVIDKSRYWKKLWSTSGRQQDP